MIKAVQLQQHKKRVYAWEKELLVLTKQEMNTQSYNSVMKCQEMEWESRNSKRTGLAEAGSKRFQRHWEQTSKTSSRTTWTKIMHTGTASFCLMELELFGHWDAFFGERREWRASQRNILQVYLEPGIQSKWKESWISFKICGVNWRSSLRDSLFHKNTFFYV